MDLETTATKTCILSIVPSEVRMGRSRVHVGVRTADVYKSLGDMCIDITRSAEHTSRTRPPCVSQAPPEHQLSGATLRLVHLHRRRAWFLVLCVPCSCAVLLVAPCHPLRHGAAYYGPLDLGTCLVSFVDARVRLCICDLFHLGVVLEDNVAGLVLLFSEMVVSTGLLLYRDLLVKARVGLPNTRTRSCVRAVQRPVRAADDQA
jgi:hypothetical protein